jgi:2-keto-4-pentenoate hydratase/2-oxohepta-3-ene-1,7-dioic acid hydratase in catechol pathway
MKIICIGRNYANHAKEMKAAVPTEPLFFMKPDTALCRDPHFYYPDFTRDLHHEIELVVKISKMGKHIDPEFAGNYYEEMGLGIDFTARDVQAKCKENGHPWEKAKAFDNSAVIGQKFIPKNELTPETPFELFVNDEKVQSGMMQDMIFTIEELIVYVSQFITLKPGDLIYTGTPEGVGAVEKGDHLTGKIDGETFFELAIK